MRVDEYCKDLLCRIERVRSSRFDAARRMKLNQSTSIFAVAFCSVYSITLSILSLKINVEENICQYFTMSEYCSFFAIVMDIFVLVISLLSLISGYENQARVFHDCALELGELEREIKMVGTPLIEEDVLKSFTEKYNQILSKYRHNHSVVDYLHASLYVGVSEYHKCCLCSEKNTKWIAFRYHFIGMHTFYILCMILPLLLFLPIIFRLFSGMF